MAVVLSGSEAPARVRGYVRSKLADADTETVETVALLADELVSNAVVHARSPLRVSVDVDSDQVKVSVADLSRSPPTPAPVSLVRRGGRGLLLVNALAEEWGFTCRSSGKVVWFVVPLGAASPELAEVEQPRA